MTKTEKGIVALVLMAVGVLFIILRGSFIGILMTVAGVCLISFGIADFIWRKVPQATVKIVSGLLLVISGWVLVEAVLYILAAILLIFGILALYDKIKNECIKVPLWRVMLGYATPVLCIAVGLLLLLQNVMETDVVLILSGVVAIVEGGGILLSTFIEG